VGVEQATAQVRPGPMPGAGSRDPGVIVRTVPSTQAQKQVDYVNAKPLGGNAAERDNDQKGHDGNNHDSVCEGLKGACFGVCSVAEDLGCFEEPDESMEMLGISDELR
jgi:hypothetical protein